MRQRMEEDAINDNANDIHSSTEQHTDEQLRALRGKGPIAN